MAGSIEDFLSSFTTDLARPNRFDVTIVTPTLLLTNSGYAERLNFRCENAELPGRTFMTHDQKIYGPTEKFPYQNSYNDLNLTFIVSDDMFERQFFDNWMNFISSTNDFNFKYKVDYCTDMAIVQYNVMGDPTYAVKLIDAYPIGINQLDLDWASDGHHKLTVVFAYTNWENVTTDSLVNTINQSTSTNSSSNDRLTLPLIS
jgi:hypothetical protein